MANNVIWWEKTVEYNFLLRFLRGVGGREVWPLGGNAELMGDGVYSLEKARWGLFEFKRDAASLSSEIVKFAVKTKKYKAAERKVTNLSALLAKISKTEKIVPRSKDEEEAINADYRSSVSKINQKLKAERTKLKSIQVKAFESARIFLEAEYPDANCHFLVYGENDSKTHSLILYSRPYFQLLNKPADNVPPGEHENRDTLVGDKVDDNLMLWDAKLFGTYLRYFMNFKLYGNSIGSESQSGTEAASAKASNTGTEEWEMGAVQTGESPIYIIGVDSTKIIIAPLDESPETKALISFITKQSPTLTSKPSI